VNNIFVSAANHALDARQFLRALPLHAVGEIHLAAYRECRDSGGSTLLIDSHDGPVQQPTWDLYAEALELAGARPTLIEWDSDLPSWQALLQQADRASHFLSVCSEGLRAAG
jgi:uncharacterized protein